MIQFNNKWSFKQPGVIAYRSRPIDLSNYYYGALVLAYALTLAFLLGGTI